MADEKETYETKTKTSSLTGNPKLDEAGEPIEETTRTDSGASDDGSKDSSKDDSSK